MLESYLAFSNADQYNRKGLHDVSTPSSAIPLPNPLTSAADGRRVRLLLLNIRHLPLLHPSRSPYILPPPRLTHPITPHPSSSHIRTQRILLDHQRLFLRA